MRKDIEWESGPGMALSQPSRMKHNFHPRSLQDCGQRPHNTTWHNGTQCTTTKTHIPSVALTEIQRSRANDGVHNGVLSPHQTRSGMQHVQSELVNENARNYTWCDCSSFYGTSAKIPSFRALNLNRRESLWMWSICKKNGSDAISICWDIAKKNLPRWRDDNTHSDVWLCTWRWCTSPPKQENDECVSQHRGIE